MPNCQPNEMWIPCVERWTRNNICAVHCAVYVWMVKLSQSAATLDAITILCFFFLSILLFSGDSRWIRPSWVVSQHRFDAIENETTNLNSKNQFYDWRSVFAEILLLFFSLTLSHATKRIHIDFIFTVVVVFVIRRRIAPQYTRISSIHVTTIN